MKNFKKKREKESKGKLSSKGHQNSLKQTLIALSFGIQLSCSNMAWKAREVSYV